VIGTALDIVKTAVLYAVAVAIRAQAGPVQSERDRSRALHPSNGSAIPTALHGGLVVQDTHPTHRALLMRPVASIWTATPGETRQLAADLLNRADLLDPPTLSDWKPE
jgi:hypothetical protein